MNMGAWAQQIPLSFIFSLKPQFGLLHNQLPAAMLHGQRQWQGLEVGWSPPASTTCITLDTTKYPQAQYRGCQCPATACQHQAWGPTEPQGLSGLERLGGSSLPRGRREGLPGPRGVSGMPSAVRHCPMRPTRGQKKWFLKHE